MVRDRNVAGDSGRYEQRGSIRREKVTTRGRNNGKDLEM